MELKQRCVIKFFSNEGVPGVKIVERLRQHYREDALSRTQVYFWINEVKRGRTDLDTIASPGREPITVDSDSSVIQTNGSKGLRPALSVPKVTAKAKAPLK
jgi:hypothetical protein